MPLHLRWGKMAPTNPQMVARDIVHFALVDARDPQVASSDTKKQFNGDRLVLL
jgi:hypothetical protein